MTREMCSACGNVDFNPATKQCESCGYSPAEIQRPAKEIYTHLRWDALLASTVEELKKLASLKGGEYAGDKDRLANFRRNGANLDLPMETIWAVYAGKHWDAIMQYIKDEREGKKRERLEKIGGRVDDLIICAILLKAMLDEKGQL